jgi:hypothetical protein
METIGYEAQYSEGVEVRLALLSYIEEDTHVIYSPALDLYGYGNDEYEARASFEITLEEYITYTAEQHTLSADLQRLGWRIDPTTHNVSMPPFASLLIHNEHLNDVVTNRPFKKFDQSTRLPAFA